MSRIGLKTLLSYHQAYPKNRWAEVNIHRDDRNNQVECHDTVFRFLRYADNTLYLSFYTEDDEVVIVRVGAVIKISAFTPHFRVDVVIDENGMNPVKPELANIKLKCYDDMYLYANIAYTFIPKLNYGSSGTNHTA